MLRWNPPLFKDKTPFDLADAEEAKALKRYLEASRRDSELRDIVAQAARVADSVARLDQALRFMR